MLSHRLHALFIGALFVCQSVSAQVLERDLGAFDLKLATTPTRSMAQGLVTPSGGSGSFHGGLDLTHESGFYFGQWAPNMGFASDTGMELDSYMGFKKPFDSTLGYELGMIRYSYPDTSRSTATNSMPGCACKVAASAQRSATMWARVTARCLSIWGPSSNWASGCACSTPTTSSTPRNPPLTAV